MNAPAAAGPRPRPGRIRPIARRCPVAVPAARLPTVSTIVQAISVIACPATAQRPGRHARDRGEGQLSLPVFSTLVISVLALLTVASKLAPCSRDFVIVGRIW